MGDTCYFSVCSSASADSPPASYVLTVARFSEDRDLSAAARAQLRLFNELFSRVDGAALSQADRSTFSSRRNGKPKQLAQHQSHAESAAAALNATSSTITNSAITALAPSVAVDDVSLTYSETEFVPFVRLLGRCGSRAGHAFYDLGCGVGKTVAAAALSGVPFIKCVGIEILPTLAQCAADTMRILQNAPAEMSGVSGEDSSGRGGGDSPKRRSAPHRSVHSYSLPLLEIRYRTCNECGNFSIFYFAHR